MTEKTIPTGNTSSDLSFSPTDFTPEELNTTEGQDEKSEETSKSEAQVVQKHKIKYNGAEEELTTEELITLAQKGKNYDHILEERDRLKNSEELTTLTELAKNSGYQDSKTFIQELKANMESIQLDKRVNELVAEGMTKEHAQKMAKLELEAKTRPNIVQESIQTKGAKEYTDLFNEFPETKDWKDLSEFPQEVQVMIKEGKSPVVAYSKYVANKAEEQRKIALQNQDASNRDAGSFKSLKTDEKEDDFLSGLNSK